MVFLRPQGDISQEVIQPGETQGDRGREGSAKHAKMGRHRLWMFPYLKAERFYK